MIKSSGANTSVACSCLSTVLRAWQLHVAFMEKELGD